MRKGVSTQYINFASDCTRAIVAHLYDFESQAGALDYFTDLDQDVYWGGNLYKSNSLRIEGMRRKTGVGLQVDEQEIKIWAGVGDTLFGGNFLENVESGLLDGAQITRRRVVWNLKTGNAALDIQSIPLAAFIMFIGYMSNITKGGQTHIEAKIKCPLVRLAVNMPQNYYQPQCNWTLFSPGCTLIKANFGVNGTVAAANQTQLTATTPFPTATGPDGIPYFTYGRLLFTSGNLDGLQTVVGDNDTLNLYFQYALNTGPAVGDTFTVYPGCSKAFDTCSNKFNNAANFRGFDRVPPVMLSL